MKKAIIVGCNGQDGKLLQSFLLEKNYTLLGIDKKFIKCPDGFFCNEINIKEGEEIFDLINGFKPDEIYYLAAFHYSSEEKRVENLELFQHSYDVHVLGLNNFLEGIKRYSPKTRLFYAASSHIFGEPYCKIQSEETPINPKCVYGITKAVGFFFCRFYRDSHSLFASTGILYNHESAFRSAKYVSKKIIAGAINIKNKKQKKLILGDLSAEVDWGYAPDYVDAMYRILQTKLPDDFIIATGERHTVRDFVKTTFEYLNLDWKQHVEENKSVITKKNFYYVGNPKKLMTATGWKKSMDFKEMIRRLLVAEGAL